MITRWLSRYCIDETILKWSSKTNIFGNLIYHCQALRNRIHYWIGLTFGLKIHVHIVLDISRKYSIHTWRVRFVQRCGNTIERVVLYLIAIITYLVLYRFLKVFKQIKKYFCHTKGYKLLNIPYLAIFLHSMYVVINCKSICQLSLIILLIDSLVN